MKTFLKASTILALLSPFVALAGGAIVPDDWIWASGEGSADSAIRFSRVIGGWLNVVIIILVGVAFVLFLWGIVQYITAGADEEKRAGARNYIIYGIIGLFVMIAAWSLVALLANILGLKIGQGLPANSIPGVPIKTSS